VVILGFHAGGWQEGRARSRGRRSGRGRSFYLSLLSFPIVFTVGRRRRRRRRKGGRDAAAVVAGASAVSA